MKLNQSELKSFMVGNLLGDGNLHNGAFITGQINEDLISFKEKIFNQYLGFAGSKITFVPANTDKKGVSRKDTWRLYVSPTDYFKDFEKKWYPDKKKVNLEDIKYLDNLGLAIWFADDGTTVHVGYNTTTGSSAKRRVQFCTDSFSLEEIKALCNILNQKGYETSIITRGVNVYRIQINGKSAQKFMLDISHYFINYFPSLLYKLDLGYRGKSLDNKTYVTPEYKDLFLKINAHPNFKDRIKEKLEMI